MERFITSSSSSSFTKIIVCFILQIFCFVSASVAAEELSFDDRQREQKLFDTVKCPTCAGQTIKDSNAEIANVLKSFIHEEIALGKNDDEILTVIREKYGDEIILKPELTYKTAFLWILPLFALIIGCYILYNELTTR